MWEIIDLMNKRFGVQYAQNGAKLGDIEVSEEPSVIPEGALHKNRHHIDLEGITKKGIPVIQNVNDSATTLREIKQAGGDLQQSAEIEQGEIIFNKELTDFVEEARKAWHDGEDNTLEVGKRIVKEVILNTNDNTGLVKQEDKKS